MEITRLAVGVCGRRNLPTVDEGDDTGSLPDIPGLADLPVDHGAPLALAIATDSGAAIVTARGDALLVEPADIAAAVEHLDAAHSPRWVWWSKDTARHLLDLDVRVAKCWDLVASHRLINGGWQSDSDRIWAAAHRLDIASIPTDAPVDLFTHDLDEGDPDQPVRPDGYLRPDWVQGGWASAPQRLEAWARLAMQVYDLHHSTIRSPADDTLGPTPDPARRERTVWSESAAEMLCAELERDGLPFDRATGESIIAGFVGPRPANVLEEREQLERRDAEVLQHLPPGIDFDLRSPDQVKSLLRRVGIEVPDTRAWRLERLVDAHPIVSPLLDWRRAERIRTTFGFAWVDEHVGADDRLRGHWSGSDGAAGRMTATAGLHNMPAELRPAIAAEPGHVFVRADLGQIEPRILAAVSGDAALARATHEDDMYLTVATRLRVERDIAKVAVLGAMYGQTTGKGAEALAGLEREYPVAMGYLRAADEAAQGGNDLTTFGGRRVRMSGSVSDQMTDSDVRSRAAARGRYGRNAMVQGAAAEFFKMWAVLVRARGAALGAHVVLCLHDELVVHAPEQHGDDVAEVLERCLQETAHRWAPAADPAVRFVADTSVIRRWSEAK
jgi:DNA polymerase family A